MEESGEQEWVFPSPKAAGGHISNVQKAANRVKDLAQVGDFVLHDLRRTAATHTTRAKIPRLIVAKILNHVESGVTAIYDRNSYDDEKRTALELWEKKLREIVGEGPSGVVPDAPIPEPAPKPEEPKPSEFSGVLTDEQYAILAGIQKMQQ